MGAKVSFDFEQALLFAETQSRFVLSVRPENQAAFENLMGDKAQFVGKVVAQDQLEMKGTDGAISTSVKQAKQLWEDAITCLMK